MPTPIHSELEFHSVNDSQGYGYLSGNLVTEGVKRIGVTVSADELDIGRKLFHRVSAMLKEAGHTSIPAGNGHYMVVIEKMPRNDVTLKLNWGVVGDDGHRAQIAVSHLLKGAAMGMGVRFKEEVGVLHFDSLQDLVSVVDAVTPREQKIGAFAPERRSR